MRAVKSQSGIRIEMPERFSEQYNSTLDCRFYGSDNLYPYHLHDLYETSPTLQGCVNRLRDFLIGSGSTGKFIDHKTFQMLMQDYALYGGYALYVSSNGLGQIVGVRYVPFESIRLGEQGADGRYTYCYYSADWAQIKTVNKKRVNARDAERYFMFSDDEPTRARRFNETGKGEVLYFSNTMSYPSEAARSCINYISTEVGVSNLVYRDTRCSFMNSSVLAIPRQSDDDSNEFIENLEMLQGDTNSFKILTIEFSSLEDKPELIDLAGKDYTDRILRLSEDARQHIIRAFGQEAFIRLSEGGLGFGSETISEIYKFYNKQIGPMREAVLSCLRRVDPEFQSDPLVY